jgi:transcriptional regulator with XRE-family HTH domain
MFLLVSCTITGMSVDEWKRAGEQIIARRIALGMTTTTALAQRTGLSARMLGDIENARRQNFAKPTIAQIEHALEWAPGSIDLILSGGDPTPLHGEQAAPVVSEQTDELARVRHIVSHTWGIAPRLVTHALAGNPTSGHLDAVSDAIGIIFLSVLEAILDSGLPAESQRELLDLLYESRFDLKDRISAARSVGGHVVDEVHEPRPDSLFSAWNGAADEDATVLGDENREHRNQS